MARTTTTAPGRPRRVGPEPHRCVSALSWQVLRKETQVGIARATGRSWSSRSQPGEPDDFDGAVAVGHDQVPPVATELRTNDIAGWRPFEEFRLCAVSVLTSH